jgi:hypothetical protein
VVKRIVVFDPPSFALAYETLATWQPGPKEDAAASALEKLGQHGEPVRTENPDLFLRKTADDITVELLESEKDVLLDAIRARNWHTFALAKKRRTVELLTNAQTVEAT